MVRALASHQCGPGSIPRLGIICGLSLLVLYSAPRGFSLGTPGPVFPSAQKPKFNLQCPQLVLWHYKIRHLNKVPFLSFIVHLVICIVVTVTVVQLLYTLSHFPAKIVFFAINYLFQYKLDNKSLIECFGMYF